MTKPRSRKSLLLRTLVFAVACFGVKAHVSAQIFTPIASDATVMYISNNGALVIGNNVPAQRAWAWTTSSKQFWNLPSPNNIYTVAGNGLKVGGDYVGNGLTFIGYPDGHVINPGIVPVAFSDDSNIMYGQDGTGSGYEARRWTEAKGAEFVGHNSGTDDEARMCSDDGGWAFFYSTGGHSWVWSKATGMKAIGPFMANSCSSDGSRAVGPSVTNNRVILLWDRSAGLTAITLPGTVAAQDVYDIAPVDVTITGDGSTLWGTYKTTSGVTHAYLWTPNQHLTDLGPDTAFVNQKPQRGSGRRFPGSWRDAQSVIHYGYYETGGTGWVDIKQLLTAHGQNLVGWSNLRLLAISETDNEMCGQADGPNGTQAFLVQLPGTARLGLSLMTPAVAGGLGVGGTVTTGVAVKQVTTVSLHSNSSAATVPGSVTVSAGRSTAHFTVATNPVDQDTTASITANQGAEVVTRQLTVQAAQVSSLSLAPNSVSAGASSTGTVHLTGPAGPSGIKVQLSSSSTSASVPVSVTINPGQTTAAFPISTMLVGDTTVATLTAAANGSTHSSALTIVPSTPTSINLGSYSILAGDSTTGYVSLNRPSGGAQSIALSSNNSKVSVPASVAIASGASQSGTFTVATTIVPANQSATISATLNGVTTTRSLTVTYAAFSISAVSPVISGHNTTGTITLPAPARTGGYTVDLNHGQASSLSMPPSATVPAGATSVNFPITVYGVNQTGRQGFFGISGSLSRVAFVTITPAPLASVQLVSNAVSAGGSTTGRAYLDGMNGTTALTVTLSSNNPNVTVPASVTIPPNGRLSFAFSVSTTAQAGGHIATITATLNGVTKTTNLSIN